MAKRKTAKTRKTKKAGARPAPSPSASRVDSVDAFMKGLSHPLKDAIERVRETIRSVDPAIQEGIKWNSPSFRTTEWFATVNVRGKDGADRVWLILHAGAKASPNLRQAFASLDPTGLMKWLAKDRALVTFEDARDVERKRRALVSILREWIRQI